MGIFVKLDLGVLNEIKDANGKEVKEKGDKTSDYSMGTDEDDPTKTADGDGGDPPASTDEDEETNYNLDGATDDPNADPNADPAGGGDPNADPNADPAGGGDPPASTDEDEETNYNLDGATDDPNADPAGDSGEIPDSAVDGSGDGGSGEGADDPNAAGDDPNYSMDDTGGEGDNPPDLSGGADGGTGGSEEVSPDEGMDQIEAEINKGLSDKEIDIRNKELKRKYVNVYNIVKDIDNRLESVTKNEENATTVDFINDKIIELKQTIYDYLNSTYDTQSYAQNLANHYDYGIVLTGIRKLFDEIKPKNKDDKRK